MKVIFEVDFEILYYKNLCFRSNVHIWYDMFETRGQNSVDIDTLLQVFWLKLIFLAK